MPKEEISFKIKVISAKGVAGGIEHVVLNGDENNAVLTFVRSDVKNIDVPLTRDEVRDLAGVLTSYLGRANKLK